MRVQVQHENPHGLGLLCPNIHTSHPCIQRGIPFRERIFFWMRKQSRWLNLTNKFSTFFENNYKIENIFLTSDLLDPSIFSRKNFEMRIFFNDKIYSDIIDFFHAKANIIVFFHAKAKNKLSCHHPMQLIQPWKKAKKQNKQCNYFLHQRAFESRPPFRICVKKQKIEI